MRMRTRMPCPPRAIQTSIVYSLCVWQKKRAGITAGSHSLRSKP